MGGVKGTAEDKNAESNLKLKKEEHAKRKIEW